MANKRSRYFAIMRGAEGTAAQARMESYLKGTFRPNYPERRGNRAPAQLIYVDPFGIPTTAGVLLEEKVNSDRFTAVVQGFVAGLVTLAAPANAENILISPGLRSPRAVIRTGVSDIGTERNSQISTLPYKDYGGTSCSVPFGMSNTVDTPTEAFNLIRTRVKANNRRNQITYVPGNYAK